MACQPRYIIPCILPFAYAIGMDGTINIDKQKWATISIVIVAMVYIIDIWRIYICHL